VGSGIKSQPTNDLVHIGVKKAALMAAVYVELPKNECNFTEGTLGLLTAGCNS